jgi:hypothetical protein
MRRRTGIRGEASYIFSTFHCKCIRLDCEKIDFYIMELM